MRSIIYEVSLLLLLVSWWRWRRVSPPPPPPPPTSKTRFHAWNFRNEVWVGFRKIPAKICIFKETIKVATFGWTFHLEFMSYVGSRFVVQTLFIMLLQIWDAARKKIKYISVASWYKLKELRSTNISSEVYNNSEIYMVQTETDLGLRWVKVKRPSTYLAP